MTTEAHQDAAASLDDAALFDAIAAGEELPEIAPQPEPQPEPQPQPEPAPAPQPAPQPEPQPTPAPQPAPQPQPDNRVPVAELLSERRARQALERQLAEIQQRQPAQPAPDFFENPEAATRQVVEPHLAEINRTLMYNARLVAGSVHGAQAVDAAEQAFVEAVNSGAVDQAEYQRVLSSPNRYAEAVNWHKRQQVLSTVGTDLDAFRQREREAALSDPQFLAQALERARAQAQPAPVVQLPGQAPRPAAPSLPSVSRMGAAAPIGQSNADQADDETLWNEVTAPRRR